MVCLVEQYEQVYLDKRFILFIRAKKLKYSVIYSVISFAVLYDVNFYDSIGLVQ